MVTHGSDRHVADRRLELDERVSLVMWVRGISLATGTEVGVVADCTLISVSNNVGLGTPSRIAERSVAVDSHVARSVGVPHLGF